MNENVLPEKLLEQARTRTIEVNDGFAVKIINIGSPDLDQEINSSALENVLHNLDLIRFGKNITVVFDNRSYPKVIKEALRSIKSRDDAITILMAISRTTGLQGVAFTEEHTVYINTQEIAFFETLGLTNLDQVTKHELAHLTQDDIDASSQAIKNLVAIFIDIGSVGAIVIKMVEMIAEKSQYTQADWLKHIGFIMLAYGFTKFTSKVLYSHSSIEKDANKKMDELKEFIIVNGRQQTLTERSARKFGSRIRDLFSSNY